MISLWMLLWASDLQIHTYAHVRIIQARCWSICSLLMLTQAMAYEIVVEITAAPTYVWVAKSPPNWPSISVRSARLCDRGRLCVIVHRVGSLSDTYSMRSDNDCSGIGRQR